MKILLLLLLVISCEKISKVSPKPEVKYDYYNDTYFCDEKRYQGYGEYSLIDCVNFHTGEDVERVVNATNIVQVVE